jgi:hypothetical protein
MGDLTAESGESTYTNFELHLIERLARIEAKQEVILQRVDSTNGKVAEHEKALQEQRIAAATETGRRKGSWRVIVVISGIVSALVSVIGAAVFAKILR